MKYGFNDAIAKVGLTKFVTDLFWVGMFYHLYNQVCLILPLNNLRCLIGFYVLRNKHSSQNKNESSRSSFSSQLATNTLERVAPLTHAVGNVLKRVFVIGFSILVFGKYIIYYNILTRT